MSRITRTTSIGFAGILLCVAIVSYAQVGSSANSRYHRVTSGPSGQWVALLTDSTDLGPAEVRSIDVLVTLRSAQRPEKLELWARSHELAVAWWSGAHFAVLSGSAQAFSSTFRIPIDSYRSRTGERFYASPTQPRIPRQVSDEVTGIGRISNYGRLAPDIVSDFVPNGGLTPSGLVEAYDATPLIDQGLEGQGETVVFVEYTPVAASDLDAFTQKFGLPTIQLQFVGGNSTETQYDTGEADMDIETVHEIAPKAHLVYFNMFKAPGLTNSSDFGASMALSLAAISHEFPGAVISMSIQECERTADRADLQSISSAAAQAEGTGSTVFASSADAGGADCGTFGADSLTDAEGVTIPAAAPNVTAVGGTTLSVATNGSYKSETTWSSPMLSQGSGGGVSTIAPRPSWQAGVGVGGQGIPDMREVPDVAADADNVTGTVMISGGKVQAGGGTSLSAPIWSGFTALIDEYLHDSGTHPLGFANPLFYSLANEGLSPSPFHDVTVGGNDYYRAGAGYDPVTGLGSPDVAVLAHAILKSEKAASS
jgi:kumamolisin